jgi:uncharacterized Tic20 family protein
MSEQIQSAPSPDDRILAAVSHFFGLVVALIIWAIQKDKSEYVRFQALQAAAFSLLIGLVTCVVITIILLCTFSVMGLSIFGIAITTSSKAPDIFMPYFSLPFMAPSLIFCFIFPYILLVFGFRVYATLSTLIGKDLQYPWLGNQVQRFIDNE